ncbi:hypothetical protein Tco_1293956 [Tanacetum coccineum]
MIHLHLFGEMKQESIYFEKWVMGRAIFEEILDEFFLKTRHAHETKRMPLTVVGLRVLCDTSILASIKPSIPDLEDFMIKNNDSLNMKWLFSQFRAKLGRLPSYISGMCLVIAEAKGHAAGVSKRWLALWDCNTFLERLSPRTLKSLANYDLVTRCPPQKCIFEVGMVRSGDKGSIIWIASRKKYVILLGSIWASSIPDLIRKYQKVSLDFCQEEITTL